jgi:drug/metabolite transporter (DMT)-like permease
MVAPALPVPTTADIRKGILYMVAACGVFTAVNAVVKGLAETYPVTEITFFRSVFALVPCAILIATHGGLPVLRTRILPQHVGRAVLQYASMFLSFSALALMPLADVVAIQFASPLFMTALSVPLLGEKVGLHRWSAVVVGFIGVLIMVGPGGDVFKLGALLVLGNALISAVISLALRRMSATESSTTLVAYQVFVTAVLGCIVAPFGWIDPKPADLVMLIAIGLSSGVGQFWWTQALRFAPAAIAAPFSYSSMIWAMALGYAVWGDLPTASLLIGAAIVVSSGLYILYRETVRRVKASAAEPH